MMIILKETMPEAVEQYILQVMMQIFHIPHLTSPMLLMPAQPSTFQVTAPISHIQASRTLMQKTMVEQYILEAIILTSHDQTSDS